MQLYKQVLENKEITVCADFRELTPLEKVQRFIKDNKETWLDAFQTIDDVGIFRVPIPDFFDVLQVIVIILNTVVYGDISYHPLQANLWIYALQLFACPTVLLSNWYF